MTPFPAHAAPGLVAWAEGLAQAIRQLQTPPGPVPLWSCDQADLPPAGDHRDAVLRVANLNILAVSDGSDWIRQDTGAAI